MSTTLLAVDDSVTMRKAIEITFAGEDYRVVTADSADAALKKAQTEKPSIALVDVTLPGQDGYALCRALKAANPGLNVVILSSKQGPYDAAKGSAAGADDFADKPFDTQSMIEKIRKLVAARAAAPAPTTAPAAPQKASEPAKSLTGTLPGGSGAAVPSPFATKPAAPISQPRTQMFGTPAPSAATATATKPATPMANFGKPQPAAAPTTPSQPAIKPAPTPAPATVVPAIAVANKPAAVSPVAAAVNGQLSEKLAGLGLTAEQADAVLALSREVVERVVWEVVPQLAETLIKEEIRRLTAEG